jgi:CheY-like chemotaxis protein
MSYQLHRVSVLVVEDNRPMLEIAKSLLLTFGVGHVIGSHDGKTGFKRYCEYNPDIVIADWMMKPVDGIEFTKQVRTDPDSPNPYVPIILMTGFSEKHRVLQARDAGVTEFLVKPFNAKDLYKRLAQVIERPRQFVHSEDFFGPDRRRKRRSDGLYKGPFRRDDDLQNAEVIKKLQKRQEEAHKTLDEIRSKAGLGKGDKFDLDPKDIDMV